MKVVVQQETLIKLLAKGALAAISDEAQGDSTSLAPLIQSVKITVDDKNMTVESAVKTLVSKFSVPATLENGIDVKETGEVVVLAKDLKAWVESQSACKIGMQLTKLDVPETVSVGNEDAEKTNVESVKKIGTFKVSSKDNAKTGSKWALDAYDPSQLPQVRSGNDPQSMLVFQQKAFKNVVDSLSSSAAKNDFNHVLDCLVIQKTPDGIYAGATDTKRCTIYRVDKIASTIGGFFSADGEKVLIPIKTLNAVIKATEESDDVELAYDSERHSVILSQGDFVTKIALPEKGVYSKFPSLEKLVKKEYDVLCTMPKNVIVGRLVTASLVNAESALFNFKGDELKIFVSSDSGKAPSTSSCSVSGLKDAYRVVWGVQHFLDIAKTIKDKDIAIGVPKDNGTYRIASQEDANLVFFAMTPVNPKYDGVTVD